MFLFLRKLFNGVQMHRHLHLYINEINVDGQVCTCMVGPSGRIEKISRDPLAQMFVVIVYADLTRNAQLW